MYNVQCTMCTTLVSFSALAFHVPISAWKGERKELFLTSSLQSPMVETPLCSILSMTPTSNPSRIKRPPRPPWGGGTQLLEGAHLTGGNTRFCRESSKCRDYVFWGGKIIKCAPFKQRIWLKCAPFKQQIWLKCAPSKHDKINLEHKSFICSNSIQDFD